MSLPNNLTKNWKLHLGRSDCDAAAASVAAVLCSVNGSCPLLVGEERSRGGVRRNVVGETSHFKLSTWKQYIVHVTSSRTFSGNQVPFCSLCVHFQYDSALSSRSLQLDRLIQANRLLCQANAKYICDANIKVGTILWRWMSYFLVVALDHPPPPHPHPLSFVSIVRIPVIYVIVIWVLPDGNY